MANEKITDLTELTAPAVADLLPVVDDVAGIPTTKKIELGTLIPTGGTADQIMTKVDGDYANIQWADQPAPTATVYQQTTGISTAAGVKKIIPLAVLSPGGISGMTITSNVIEFPVGKYAMSISIGGLVRCNYGTVLLWDEDADALVEAGPIIYAKDDKSYFHQVCSFSHYFELASSNNYALYLLTSDAATQRSYTSFADAPAPIYGSFMITKLS